MKILLIKQKIRLKSAAANEDRIFFQGFTKEGIRIKRNLMIVIATISIYKISERVSDIEINKIDFLGIEIDNVNPQLH